jgi:hypothetical protein
MSDRLSELMQSVTSQMPREEISHEDAMINALDRALEATTPERPGCPWDTLAGDKEQEEKGLWVPGTEGE